MREIEVLGYALGVVDVIERAAAMLLGAIALQFGQAALIPELHREADDGMALFLENSSDGGRVHTTGHGDGDEAVLSFFASRKRVELCHRIHAGSIVTGNASDCLRGNVRGARFRAGSHAWLGRLRKPNWCAKIMDGR